MRRCVIVGGAEIKDYGRIRKALRPDDYFVFCDCGLSHLKQLDVTPDLIVGDFDSYHKPDVDIETIVLPCEKDDTDTLFAVKESIKHGFSDFLLIGVIGQRFDHSLGNISVLLMLEGRGCTAQIIDDYSEMMIVSDHPVYVDDSFRYFSLLAINGDAKGVTIKNAKYELDNAIITCEYQYGISNEPLPGKVAEIIIREGRLLLIKCPFPQDPCY